MKLVRSLCALVVLAATLTGLSTSTSTPASAASWNLLRYVASIEVDGTPGTAVDHERGLLYVASLGRVSVYRTDTLRLVREHTIDFGNLALGLHVDEVNGRLFIAGQKSTTSPPAIAVVDEDSGESVPSWEFPAQYAGHSTAAVTYDPRGDDLYAITRIFGQGQLPDPLVALHKLDAAVVAEGGAAESRTLTGYVGIDWSYAIDGCPSVTHAKTGGFLGLIPEGAGQLFFLCSAPNLALQAVMGASPATAAVVIDTATLGKTGGDLVTLRRDDPAFSIEQHPLPAVLDRPFVTGAGPGRLMAATSWAGQQKVFVFDAVHRAWTGAVPLGPANVAGGVTDPWNGRTFVMQELSSQDGLAEVNLVVTDASALPVPQGLALTLLDENNAPLSKAGSWMSYDTTTRRLFVPADTPDRVLVYEDRIPVEVKPVPDDPDARTSNVDEAGANVSYAGEASAFGARHRMVNGIGGLGLSAENIKQLSDIPRPSEGDRSSIFGWSELARLNGTQEGSGEASADARRLSFDESTTTDMGLLGLPVEVTGQWAPSSCSSSRDEDQSQERPGSSVVCGLADDFVRASAETRGSELAGMPVQIGGASSEVFVHRDPELGVVAEATATARGVVIGGTDTGALVIGEATTKASAVAKGVPGSAGTKFEPQLQQVAIIAPDGTTPFSCNAGDACDPVVVAAAINRYLAPKIQAIPPRRDESDKVAGSPGGARAVVIQDPYAYVHDKNTSNDDSATVAALQLIVYHDGQGASREFIELAGVLVGTLYTVTAGVDVPPADPGSLAVSLLDEAGAPLSGGVFELRADAGLPPIDETVEDVTDTTDTTLPGDESTTTTTTSVDPSGGSTTTTTTTDGAGTTTTSTTAATGALTYRAAAAETTTSTTTTTTTVAGDDTTSTTTDDGTTDTSTTDGLDDALVASGTCVTAEDGTGDCTFEDLAPGAYIVSQAAAPAGYVVSEDVPVTVAPGMATTVTVTNVKSSAGIAISLTDDRVPPTPLAGGEFVIVADDGDGLLGDADVELGRCTTGADGACAPFADVPLGAYVVHQAAAPAGFVPAADLAFVLDLPGQNAVLAFVNGAPPTDVAPAASEPPSIGVANVLPPPPPPPAIVTSEPIQPRAPSSLRRAISAPREMASFLARSPGEAALFAGLWSLLLAPAYLLVRRRKLNVAKEGA